MSRALQLVAWACVAALFWPPPARSSSSGTSFSQRLLGPIASALASVEWVRFDMRLRDGENERAYLHAERALELDPGSPAGWYTLARHLIFERASFEIETDPERRREWIEAGLDVLERGASSASQPELLWHLHGTTLAHYVADIAEDVGWPGGSKAAIDRGIQTLERAAAAGFTRSLPMLSAARERRASEE